MNKKLKILLFFNIIFILFFLLPQKVMAGDCEGGCGFTIPCSDSRCAGCLNTCQPTNSPNDPYESIEGRVHNPVLPERLSTLPGATFLQKLLRSGIVLVFVVGAVIFFFMLLSGGIRWITGGGDKGKLEGAQKQITHALVGLALLLSSFAIIQLIETLFGISLLNISLPTL